MYRESPQRLKKANVDMHSSKSQEPTIMMADRTLGFTLKGFPYLDWLREERFAWIFALLLEDRGCEDLHSFGTADDSVRQTPAPHRTL